MSLRGRLESIASPLPLLSSSAMSEPATVTATLNYTVAPLDNERLFRYTGISHAPNGRTNNVEQEKRTVQIENLRGNENAVTLDSNGFQFFRRPAKHREFRVDEDIQKEYYLESEHLIKELTGASRVVFFDHSTLRCAGLRCRTNVLAQLFAGETLLKTGSRLKTVSRQRGCMSIKHPRQQSTEFTVICQQQMFRSFWRNVSRSSTCGDLSRTLHMIGLLLCVTTRP
jgi:hypothetical protein